MSKQTDSALVQELRAAGHDRAADKHAALDELYSRIGPDRDGHRPLTEDELKIQADNTLSMEEMQAAQRVEYGTYVAGTDIYHGSGMAYAAGHPVPVSAVEQHGYDKMGLVARVSEPAKPSAPAKMADKPPAAAKDTAK